MYVANCNSYTSLLTVLPEHIYECVEVVSTNDD